jgi:hypothetical protein
MAASRSTRRRPRSRSQSTRKPGARAACPAAGRTRAASLHVEHADPLEALAGAARERRACLAVVGTRGRGRCAAGSSARCRPSSSARRGASHARLRAVPPVWRSFASRSPRVACRSRRRGRQIRQYGDGPAGRHVRRVGGHDRTDRRPVRARSVRFAARPCAHRRVPRGGRRIGLLRQRGHRLRRGLRADRGVGLRHGVLRRLHRREEPVGRQPVRVRGDHVGVRGAPRAPAAGPDVRDPRRARHARRLHCPRRGIDLGLLVHVPDLRAAAAVHGDPALSPPGRGPRRR